MSKLVQLAVCVLVASVLPACAGDGAPRKIRPGDAERELRAEWQTAVASAAKDSRTGRARDWQMQVTTWLPGEWPPAPRTVWTRYAYGLDVTLDGSAGVSAPFARLERGAGESAPWVLIPMSAKIKAIANHPVRPHGGWNYTFEDEKRILSQALALASAPPPNARDTEALISYYKSWRLGSAEIAALVEPRHRAFFAWLSRQ